MTAAVLLHASCVAVAGRAVLITGPSGSGKSSLALTLLAHGAALVADLALPEPDRLPPRRKVTLLGTQVDLVLGHGNDHLPAAVLCYLNGTRQA